MNDKKEFKYVQFPNCLLMQTYDDIEKGLRMIIDYGIVHYAKKQSYNLHDVARQVCYDYYRNRDLLQYSVINTIRVAENHDQFSEVDHDGFSWDSFNPEDNINEILLLFENDSSFKKTCILNYQIHLVCSQDQLNIKLRSYQRTIETYDKAVKIQESFERQFGPDAMPYCKVSMLWQFIDNPKDIDLFRAYIGIKSMIGRRNFISSNKPAILSRMIGCKNKAAFEFFTANRYNKNKNLLPTVEKYSKRYNMDKLLLTLAERKYIMFLSKKEVRVIYLSKYMEPEELGKLIKETKERQNIKQRIKNVTATL
jgi:hypothetical protein